ncbi:hypothetical protein BDFB_005420 [Asbolus verrucosus]|uniref:C2H2-type domain-containing protein n=1 Tax=Asbolus verrucosus TaxID=1661398 RepID=A0A482VXR1_ASBVE|nr:hypothetical protein BDFB_005420 [Asbolus verrucosus]
MASSNSGVQQQQQQQPPPQHFQQPQQLNTSPHHCKECGLYLNSAESLEVHLQYHKENLLNKWATQAATSHSEETNNNNPKANIKREFITNNTIAAADSSDSMNKKSPEYSRTTPETIFGHPPTPQSYQSASSPYQNHDNSAFSPNFQNFQLKQERTSPNSHYQNNYNNFTEPQFFGMEANQNQQYPSQDFAMHKAPVQNASYRYHPYQQSQHSPYDRPQSNSQVSSSSPAYPPQPTPSPSPKQCDKCGYVCDSASQLIEHLNMAHPPTPASHISSYHPNQHFLFNNDPQQPQIKTEDDAQSEILDLDSHKVHQVYPEDEKRQNGELNGHNPHSVSALLNSWSPPQQQKMYQQEQRMFMNGPGDQKIFPQDSKMFQQDQKLFQPHQIHNQEFMGNNVTTTTQENVMQQAPQGYRPFEHLPAQPNAPVISSTQVPNNPPQTTVSPATKSANWKSNEARRPKTYNCTACNKWFTSSGHLKRHYNTTLHKNAVKSSGQPDPASLPISAHHHPARESSSNKEDQGSSPGDEDTNSMPPQFERSASMPGLLQQPPNGPYDRQPPPNIHHTPPLHSHPSPLGNPLVNPSNLTNLSNGSPPNGEAGLSPTNLDSRGLLSLSTTPNATPHHGFNMGPPPHMMPIENSQFQMYPNGSAPHVTQVTATSNLNITGEFHQLDAVSLQQDNSQPLPSFAQFQAHRYGLLMSYGNANVGGGGPATAPYCYYPDPFETTETRTLMYKTDDDEYRLTVLTVADPAPAQEELIVPYSPPTNNNNNNNNDPLSITESKFNVLSPPSPEKAHIKRDYEESTGSPQISSTVQSAAKQGLYKCIDCDKTFNKACYLTQHNKTFHSGDKPFKCGRCGKRFSSEETHEEHTSKHAGDKPHKCDRCPKQFNHKTDLRRHMCLHTGQKPFVCDTCGKGFIRKDHMLKHCETHFRKTQNKIAAGHR